MGKLYAAFVQVDAEQPFVYRLSEESIKQEFPDGTIETENFLLVKMDIIPKSLVQAEHNWIHHSYMLPISWCIIR
jgi:hypothetical protein